MPSTELAAGGTSGRARAYRPARPAQLPAGLQGVDICAAPREQQAALCPVGARKRIISGSFSFRASPRLSAVQLSDLLVTRGVPHRSARTSQRVSLSTPNSAIVSASPMARPEMSEVSSVMQT